MDTAKLLPSVFSYAVPLPSLTPEYSRVIICGMMQRDTSMFCLVDLCKMAFLFHDLRKRQDFCLSVVFLMDMTNYDAGHLTKISIPLLKKVVSSQKVLNITSLSLCYFSRSLFFWIVTPTCGVTRRHTPLIPRP